MIQKKKNILIKSQSLFYWITYSYIQQLHETDPELQGLNPYFIGLPILIRFLYDYRNGPGSLNPYFIGLPILIT